VAAQAAAGDRRATARTAMDVVERADAGEDMGLDQVDRGRGMVADS